MFDTSEGRTRRTAPARPRCQEPHRRRAGRVRDRGPRTGGALRGEGRPEVRAGGARVPDALHGRSEPIVGRRRPDRRGPRGARAADAGIVDAATNAARAVATDRRWMRPGLRSVDPIVSYRASAAARTVAHASPVPTYLAAPRWNLRCAPWKGGTRRHTPAAGGACGGLAIAARETRVPQCEFSRVAFPRRYARLAQARRPAMSATPGLAR